MGNYLKDVAEFHQTFEHPILPAPGIPNEKRCKLRVELISEELKELQEGIDNKDIVEIADALADIQYVLAGAILEFGLKDKFDAIFAEVHRSNMTKACIDRKEVIDTQALSLEQGVETEFKTKDIFVDGNYSHSINLVFRKSDNKLVKSINYSPANLKQFFDE